MNLGVVLGGGGVTGIAWELGLLAGLHARGVELGRAELIVGTSAGSVVGALLAAGVPLDAAVAQQRAAPETADAPAVDMAATMAAFAVLFDPQIAPRDARIRVGRMALDAPVMDEASYLAIFAALLPVQAWPASPRLVITGVDAVTGEPARWDHASGVPLVRAVAASCAVPCVFPPVTIGASRYMDGGVRSVLNADLAAGARAVVVIAPIAAMAAASWARERVRLGDAASVLIGPDEAALEAIGPNVMDPSRRLAALEAGLAQAERVESEVRAIVG